MHSNTRAALWNASYCVRLLGDCTKVSQPEAPTSKFAPQRLGAGGLRSGHRQVRVLLSRLFPAGLSLQAAARGRHRSLSVLKPGFRSAVGPCLFILLTCPFPVRGGGMRSHRLTITYCRFDELLRSRTEVPKSQPVVDIPARPRADGSSSAASPEPPACAPLRGRPCQCALGSADTEPRWACRRGGHTCPRWGPL